MTYNVQDVHYTDTVTSEGLQQGFGNMYNELGLEMRPVIRVTGWPHISEEKLNIIVAYCLDTDTALCTRINEYDHAQKRLRDRLDFDRIDLIESL